MKYLCLVYLEDATSCTRFRDAANACAAASACAPKAASSPRKRCTGAPERRCGFATAP